MKLLVSCISTKHSILKEHWRSHNSIAGQETGTECPLTVLGSYEKPKEDLGGALCLIEDKGIPPPRGRDKSDPYLKTVELQMAAGMVTSEKGVFVTSFGSVHEVDADLSSVRQHVVSSPLFNALHSISRTQRGYLVASTGLDLLLEFNRDGEILWSWWATDHGFELMPSGRPRVLDKSVDHRTIKYGTLSQTTHINSAAELPDGRILASLFHQGTVIVIDRETGAWQVVLEGLDHPHAVRVLDEGIPRDKSGDYFTVADTVHGKALLVRTNKKGGHVEEEIDAGTNWLQDCHYDRIHNCWILVDGKNSRISLRRGRSGERTFAQFDFDPEWRLYEAHIL
jgi:hypothetical protein